MITFITKIPNGPLNRGTRFGLQRLNCTVRSYANQPHPKKPTSTGAAYTVGAITLVGAATVGYAAYEPEFRKWMGDNVPGADDFFKFLFQEERPWSAYLERFADSLKSMVTGDGSKRDKVQTKEYTLLGWTVQVSFKPKED